LVGPVIALAQALPMPTITTPNGRDRGNLIRDFGPLDAGFAGRLGSIH
jgi:hypothetical protein